MHTPKRTEDSNSGYSILRSIAMECSSPQLLLCGIALFGILAGQSLGFRQDPTIDSEGQTQNSNEQTPSGTESDGNAYEAAQRSLDWLSKSMQRVTDKLDSMSKKMDPSASQEEIERELKKAVREAFSELSPALAPNTSDTIFEKKNIPSIPKARTGTIGGLGRKQAEVAGPNSSAFQILNSDGGPARSGDASESNKIDDESFNKPLLGDNAPSWVRERIVSTTRLRAPIASSLFESLEECRKDIDQRLLEEVRIILVQNGFGEMSTSWPEGALTESYIREHFLADSEFDNVQELPSGTYHQLWVLLDIDETQLSYLKHWERQFVGEERAMLVGLTMISIVATIASFSAIVGFIAYREKKLA
ncbi:MAG: hypothetical protein ACK5O8_12120 [Pirellula sp.]|jgi:hypothetical protein